jgi:integrase
MKRERLAADTTADTERLSEEIVRGLSAPAGGNRVYYFAGHRLQGLVAPRGFGVRVTAGGAKAFVLNYRAAGQERRYTIGLHPDWSVVRALKAARDLRQEIDAGRDPQAAKAEARSPTPVPGGKTVADVLDDHVRRYARNKDRPLRSADEIARTFERLVKPAIGAWGIYELRRSHVVEMLDKIEDENGPVMADRTLAYVRKAFTWFAARDDAFTPPIVRGMSRTKPKERARRRILADDEIRDLWAALDALETPSCYPAYVRTLLLSAQRRSDVGAMTWAEIDGETWTISAERYKTRLDHAVPLTKAVRDLIGRKPAPRRGPHGRSIEPGPFVFSTAFGHKAFSGYSSAKRRLDKKLAELRAKAGREPMANWTLHDLRRSARSLMSRAGVPSDNAERVLGHVIPGVRGVYDRHAYLDEKRDALDRLAALVATILNPPDGNVRRLDEKRLKRTAKAGAA